MTEDQYIEVCKITDEILQSKSSSSTRVALPFLHVVRGHHLFLQKYENIYEGAIIGYYKAVKLKLFNVIALCIVLLQSMFYSKHSQWLKKFNKSSKRDILFVSHLINKSHYCQKNDFYFSDLPQKVSEAGFKSLVVMINHAKISLIENNNEKKLQKTVLPLRLGFYEELKNVSLLWAEYKTLKTEMRSEKTKIKKKLLYFAAIESLSPSALTSLRIGTQIGGLVKILEPKTLITTYEGHAWERKVINNAKQVNQNINCIAYSGAPIFKNQHAIKRSLDKQFNPDIILVSGPIQRQQLENYGLLKNIEIDVLGSVRCNNGKEKEVTLNQTNKIVSKKKQFFLVAPEGVKKEIALLFDFSLKCAKAMPECNFIWRLHPHYGFNKLKYKDLPGNITLSDKALKYDLLNAHWVLYRASSVVIEAVIAGLKPIYLHEANEIKIDAIYGVDSWKSEVESVKDFESTVKNKKGDFSDYHKALKYCNDLYSPLNEEVLIEAIKKNKFSRTF